MDILINEIINKMNNNISGLQCNLYGEDGSEASRVPVLDSECPPVSPTKRKHHGNKDSDKGQMNKMRCLFASHLTNPNESTANQESWNVSSHGHSGLSGLHSHRVFAPFPIFAFDRPFEMNQQSLHPTSSMLPTPGTTTKQQQNRPSVITCAPASNRPCSLSSCHMSPDSCTSGSANKTNANNVCDPVIEEHFHRSLGDIYKEALPISNSVSTTGSVDDHFTKALGDAWLQIKAKGNSGTAPNHVGTTVLTLADLKHPPAPVYFCF